MRLFYAIWPDDQVRDKLVSVSSQLKTGQIVTPANLHITLLFLGEVNDEIQADLIDGTNHFSGKEFTLTLSRFDRFKRAGIFWLGPSSYPAELIKLVNYLSDLAVKNHIFVDSRPYRPHVTLARKFNSSIHLEPPTISWPVTDFSLVESKTLPEGVKYRVLHTWPLT